MKNTYVVKKYTSKVISISDIKKVIKIDSHLEYQEITRNNILRSSILCIQIEHHPFYKCRISQLILTGQFRRQIRIAFGNDLAIFLISIRVDIKQTWSLDSFCIRSFDRTKVNLFSQNQSGKNIPITLIKSTASILKFTIDFSCLIPCSRHC